MSAQPELFIGQKYQGQHRELSMYMNQKKLHSDAQLELPAMESASLPGSFDDDSLVRGLITDAIKKSNKSRAQVAEQMSALLGREVSLRTLNAFTADSREQHRWPLAWTRAFCEATGDWRLIKSIVERAGLHLITPEEIQLMELGRQYLRRKDADAAVVRLEQSLSGGSR